MTPKQFASVDKDHIPVLTKDHAPHLYMLAEMLDCDECIAWLAAHAKRLKGPVVEAG